MNLNKRIETLEIERLLGNGVTVISLETGETNEQALKRYCAENRITDERFDHPESLTVFLRTDFGD